MPVHLARQLEKLKKMIVNLGAMVEEALRHATEAIEKRDPDLAAQVIAGDRAIDLMEIDVEEECLATLALHQPVASDLRYVVTILKINRDLERIADLAASMAEQAVALAAEPAFDLNEFRLGDMTRLTQDMLKQSLDALVQFDVALAEKVRQTDDQVDAIYRGMYGLVEQKMRQDPNQIDIMVRVLSVTRQIERLADHTVNIAKDVVYLATGQIVRHRSARQPNGAATPARGL